MLINLLRDWALRRAVKADAEAVSEPPLGAATYAASAVINILALALPLTILQIYDRVLPNAAFDTLTALFLALAGVIVLDGILKYFRSLLVNWTAASFTHKLSIDAVALMMATPPGLFSQKRASDHLDHLNTISNLGGYLGGQSRIIAIDVLFIPIFAIVIMMVGGPMIFVVAALFAFFGHAALKRSRTLNEEITQRELFDSRKSDFFIEVLRALQTVKTSVMEPLMMRRFERLQSSASLVTKRIIMLTGEAQTYSAVYGALSVTMIVGIGGALVINGQLSLGALACCMLLSSQLLQPLMRSFASLNDIRMAERRKAQVLDALNEGQAFAAHADQIKCAERSRRVQLPRLNPQPVYFRDVKIQYDNATPLFENLTLTIPAGHWVAFTGDDGSGRTTLLRAIMDDAPIIEGDVRIGAAAKNAKDAPRVCYLSRTPSTFRGTILENLTLFGEIATKNALTMSRLVGLDDEVARIPLGYETPMRSSGSADLPIATIQRVAIARALALRPSVLVLDEIDTSLDLAGERRFISALQRLRPHLTIVFITQRPSLMRLADEIYRVKNGVVSPIADACTDGKVAS